MEWIYDCFFRLVRRSKSPLVMSDAKDVEVDEGFGAWEEERDTHPVRPVSGPSISRAPLNTQTPRHSLPPSYSPYPMSPPNSTFPRKRQFEPDSVHRSPGRSTRTHEGRAVPSTPAHAEHWWNWMHLHPSSRVSKSMSARNKSPDPREWMERARVSYLQRRFQCDLRGARRDTSLRLLLLLYAVSMAVKTFKADAFVVIAMLAIQCYPVYLQT